MTSKLLSLRRLFRLAVIAPVAFLVVLLVQLASAQTSTQIPNPEEGLSDAERRERHERGWREFEVQYQQWLADFSKSGVNPQSLDQRGIDASYVEPLQDLPSAVELADLIVTGVVKSLRFEAFTGTFVTLSVEDSLKGSVGAEVVVHLQGGPMPERDYKAGYLAVAENEIYLFEGDRVLLLLSKSEGSVYEPLSFTGTYKIDTRGQIVAVEENPFKSNMEGRQEAEVTATIETLLKR